MHKHSFLCLSALAVLTGISVWGARPEDLRAHVEFLASDELGGRLTPSEGLDTAGAYIAAQFRRAGLKPQPDGTYFQAGLAVGERNVVGVLEGSDAALGKQYVLVTAHYDHVGSRCKGSDNVCNGANDNASGVSSLIEIARQLAARKPAPARTIVFMTFYGEEAGLVGSRWYAAHPIWPVASTVVQINLEQTGRPDDLEGGNPRTLNVTGYRYSQVGQILKTAALPLGVRILERAKWTDEAFDRSDNEALARAGVPAHTLSAAYMFPDYHKAEDEWPKLDYANMAAITNAAARGILTLASRPEPPHWYKGAKIGASSATALTTPIDLPVRTKPAAKP